MQPLSQLYKQLLGIIFPSHCPVCGLVPLDAKLICSECSSKIAPLAPYSSCPACGGPLEIEEDCFHCMKHGCPVEKSYICFPYNELTRKIVHAFKFAGRSDLIIELFELAAEKINFDYYFQSIDAVIPIPLHKRRLHERGYNQSEILSSYVSRKYGIPSYTDAVIRNKYTQAQSSLPEQLRMVNLVDVFEVPKPFYIKQKNILLVDDVRTTGSTLRECARALWLAGAIEVRTLSLTAPKYEYYYNPA